MERDHLHDKIEMER